MPTTFDSAELLQRIDNDREFLAETVEMLSTDGRSLMNDLRGAIAAKDAPTVGRVAHALKGMISNFCAPSAHQAAQEMEGLGKSGELDRAQAMIDEFGRKLEALILELEGFVRSGA